MKPEPCKICKELPYATKVSVRCSSIGCAMHHTHMSHGEWLMLMGSPTQEVADLRIEVEALCQVVDLQNARIEELLS